MADPVDQAQMALLIRRDNEAAEAEREAADELALWVRRGKLAVEAGRHELAVAAKARAEAAKRDLLAARAELDAVKHAKRALRKQANRPDGQPTFDAEMLVEQFRLQGFAPEEQEAKEVAARMEAELTLGALTGQPPPLVAQTPAVSEAPSPTRDDTTAEPTAAVDKATAAPAAHEAPLSEEEDDLSALERELQAIKAAAGAAEDEIDDDALAALEKELGGGGSTKATS